jgi:resuscitation-promoting factor RpfB
VSRRSDNASARIDALLAQAHAAEQASERLTRAARTSGPATTTAAAPKTATPAPAGATTRTLVVDAVAYHLPGHTASGLPVGVGVVAVDPNVIPLGTRMFIPGYGPGVAADVGSAIRGNVIDLWMPSTAAARRWGRRTVTITIYG